MKCSLRVTGCIAAFFWVVGLLPTHAANAKIIGSTVPTVRVFLSTGTLSNSFTSYAEGFRGGVHVASNDVDGDGIAEIITGAGRGGGPEVKIFRTDGTLISHFFAYGKGFRGGVNVASYDLDADGKAEIITGPSYGGGPEVKVFRSDGSVFSTFFAYDKKFRGGVNVTAGKFGDRNEPLIITGSGYGGSHVRSFTPTGKYAGLSVRPFGKNIHGVVVTELKQGSGRSKLVVAEERSAAPLVKVLNLKNPQQPAHAFYAYRSSFLGGTRLASADTNGDGNDEIVTGAGSGGGPNVKIFTESGHQLESFLALDATFRGGINVAASDKAVIVAPSSVLLEGRTDLFKYIEVDLSEQMLRYYQEGRLIDTHRVSTGKWTTPTPIGTFRTYNKIPVAYSKPFDLYMEWWMAFTPDGSYGVHALPYWLNEDGSKRYEGEHDIGLPASHGCIRQSKHEAIELYNWAEIGTPVIVKR